MSFSVDLGQVQEVGLPMGRIRFRETGSGAPVVFVHGLLANADLWRNVVPEVAGNGYRCIAPDWPLGSHEIPMPFADLSPAGVASIILAFLDELDLHDVTLVANDTGGGMVQIAMARHPERVARVVLTPSDSYTRFPPPPLAALPPLAHIPGSMWPLVQALRIRLIRESPLAFGWVAKRPLPDKVIESFLAPSRRNPDIRRDLRRLVKGMHKRHTLEAAKSFPNFNQPVLLAWAADDKLFPRRLASRLLEDLPNAELQMIDDSYTFVSEDQPQALTALLLQFLRHTSASQA